MSAKHLGLVVPVALGLAACGGGAGPSTTLDISGMYQVTHHTESMFDCTTEGAAVTDVPYFRVVPATGKYAYIAVSCTGADVSTCPTDVQQAAVDGETLGMFETPASDGWETETALGIYYAGCMLTYTLQSAHVVDGGLRIENKTWFEMPTLDAAACTSAEALSRGGSMPCAAYVVIAGTKQ